MEKKSATKEKFQRSINAYKANDHYVHYLEMMPNPAEVFELTKFGKSYAYIIAPVATPATTSASLKFSIMRRVSSTFMKLRISGYDNVLRLSV